MKKMLTKLFFKIVKKIVHFDEKIVRKQIFRQNPDIFFRRLSSLSTFFVRQYTHVLSKILIT